MNQVPVFPVVDIYISLPQVWPWN